MSPESAGCQLCTPRVITESRRKLVEVGTDHRQADPEPLRALARAVEG